MTRNKYNKYGKPHWDDNRRMRNKIVALCDKSLLTFLKTVPTAEFLEYCVTIHNK